MKQRSWVNPNDGRPHPLPPRGPPLTLPSRRATRRPAGAAACAPAPAPTHPPHPPRPAPAPHCATTPARDGRARSVYEVYENLAARYASAANSPATQTALAIYGATPVVAVASAAPPAAPAAIDNAAYLSTFPDTHAVTPVTLATVASAS